MRNPYDCRSLRSSLNVRKMIDKKGELLRVPPALSLVELSGIEPPTS